MALVYLTFLSLRPFFPFHLEFQAGTHYLTEASGSSRLQSQLLGYRPCWLTWKQWLEHAAARDWIHGEGSGPPLGSDWSVCIFLKLFLRTEGAEPFHPAAHAEFQLATGSAQARWLLGPCFLL
jgi:hypothetical protein